MWFWLSLIALLCWSGSDLFSKIGCRDARDKYSHLKMVMAVGVVMGLHAAYEVFVGGTVINLDIILTYLPVSILYILSMAMGYVGLRYIELSISSPICNSSGALVAVLAILFDGIAGYSPLALFAVALVCVGAVGLGVVEAREDDELRIERQKASNYKYTKSFMALAMPAAYCVLDAAGTFADSRVLEIISRTVEDYEASANVAYELTFLLAAVVCFVYVVLIKRDRLVPKMEAPKYLGAVCETAGQFAYIYAIADTEHLLLLRGLRAVEPDLPEGEALLEALRHDRADRGGHCHHGRVRSVMKKSPLCRNTEGTFFMFQALPFSWIRRSSRAMK